MEGVLWLAQAHWCWVNEYKSCTSWTLGLCCVIVCVCMEAIIWPCQSPECNGCWWSPSTTGGQDQRDKCPMLHLKNPSLIICLTPLLLVSSATHFCGGFAVWWCMQVEHSHIKVCTFLALVLDSLCPYAKSCYLLNIDVSQGKSISSQCGLHLSLLLLDLFGILTYSAIN